MKYLNLLTLIILIHTTQCEDYNSSYITSCSSLIYSDQLRNVFILHYFDRMFIEIVFPVSLLACILTIVIYIQFKATREQPGDIILALSITQIFTLSVYLSTAIYNTYYPAGTGQSIPDSFSQFCLTTGYLYAMSFAAEFIYNIAFCAFFIIRIKNVLKGLQDQAVIIHIMCILFVIVVGAVLYLSDGVGVSIDGVCGLKISKFSSYVKSILIIVYLTCLIITIVYFKKYLPKQTNNSIYRKTFLRYYYRYIITVSINLLVQSTSSLVSAVNCSALKPDSRLEIFVTFNNVSTLMTSIIIFSVIVFHPEVISWLKERYRKLKKYIKGQDRQSINSKQVQLMNNNYSYLQSMIENNKSSLIYTILAALSVQDSDSNYSDSIKDLNLWNYQDKSQFTMNNQILQQNQDLVVDSFKLMNVRIVSHSPKVFKTLMHYDNFTTLATHLNPRRNIQGIKKCSSSDGGKSGQFFFFTYDNKIILKTLKKQELQVILERVKQYAQYFEKNRNSLIVKFYGVYTFTNVETNDQYHIFMMKNLAGCSRQFIDRIYDMKGSKFDRKVLKDYTNVDKKIKSTMKDLDFHKLEIKVNINPQKAELIRCILIQDSRFLMRQKLIDYSLIVMKVSLNQFCQAENTSIENLFNLQSNPYLFAESITQEGTYYAFGIIDYLQTWNVKKKGQKLTKRLLFFTKSDQISAQSPDKYSTRFIQQLVNIIF